MNVGIRTVAAQSLSWEYFFEFHYCGLWSLNSITKFKSPPAVHESCTHMHYMLHHMHGQHVLLYVMHFPHLRHISPSCVCERSIYSHGWNTYFHAAEQADWSEEYIIRSQKYECIGKGTVAAQFLSWEYLFRIFGIVSLQCGVLNSVTKFKSPPAVHVRGVHCVSTKYATHALHAAPNAWTACVAICDALPTFANVYNTFRASTLPIRISTS